MKIGGAVSGEITKSSAEGESNCCAAEQLNLMPEAQTCQQTYILYKIGEYVFRCDTIFPVLPCPHRFTVVGEKHSLRKMSTPTKISDHPPAAPAIPAAFGGSPSFQPLYDQIKILLTRSLIGGEWKPGEAIPSEMDLAARYQVSQGTVRKAIDALAAENILIRRQGKGTFVATHTEPKTQYRFLRIIPDKGEKIHPKTSFIDVKRGKAITEIARALDLKVGAPITAIRRVLVFAGKPVILDEVTVPSALVPNLTLEHIQESQGSIYSFFETTYGLRMIRAEERLRAVAADAFSAKHLQVKPGAPLLCVDRIAFTYGDKPVEWRRGLCQTYGYSYYNELA